MRVGLPGCGLLLGLLLAACERGPAPGAAQAGHVTRIVSLHDVTSELVVALGAQAQLVGIEEPVDATDALKQQLQRVPRVSGLESILASRPDLVLGLGVLGERDPELVSRLRQAGVEVHLDQPLSLDDVDARTRWVSQRLGIEERGEQVVAALHAQVDGPTADAPPAQPLRVFVYDCCDPPFTAGGRTVLSDLIARAGGRNVFAALPTDWAHVSWEDVVARKPELIVVHAYRYEGQGDAADKQRALRAIPGLEQVPTAVLPLGCSLGGLRSGEGLTRLRAAMQGRS